MEYPSKASAPPTLPDSFAPQQFNGVVPDAETWLLHFQRYADYKQMNNDDKAAFFPLFLKDSAIDWYDNLQDEIKNDFAGTIAQFQSFFCKTAMDHVLDADSVFSRVQRPSERVRAETGASHAEPRRGHFEVYGATRSSSNHQGVRSSTTRRGVIARYRRSRQPKSQNWQGSLTLTQMTPV